MIVIGTLNYDLNASGSNSLLTGAFLFVGRFLCNFLCETPLAQIKENNNETINNFAGCIYDELYAAKSNRC